MIYAQILQIVYTFKELILRAQYASFRTKIKYETHNLQTRPPALIPVHTYYSFYSLIILVNEAVNEEVVETEAITLATADGQIVRVISREQYDK